MSAMTLAAIPSRPPRPPATTTLSGWGANLRAACFYTKVETPAEVKKHVDRAGTIARGLGRSYGDPALNAGGQVIGLDKVDRYLSFDEATGTLTCEAGVSLAQIIRDFAPRGWFPMITPGTKYVTVGGCIANDVHGKAHHAQGCFSVCVDAMTVLLASGEVVVASRESYPDLFWGTFGGMGLLGIVLTATIRLNKIESTYFRHESIYAANLDAMLTALDDYNDKYPYSVATIDAVASGARLGRGYLSVGDHARRDELPPALAKDPLRLAGERKIPVPFELPDITINPLSLRLGNAAILAIQSSKAPFKHYENFFYPLDMLHNWNRAYGRRGFAQYQFVLPMADSRKSMHGIISTILSAGELPLLNVLKRLGKESGGILSFPREGYTFAIDLPIRKKTVELLRRLDGMVLDAGGRTYLGKDSYMTAETFRAMYPAIDEWLRIKAKYDPDNVFVSDLGRRIGLVPTPRDMLESGTY
jgi:decaprenylphospho-beta-D-ribofuranose 2-oxidase